MISRTFEVPVSGVPKSVPSYEDLCDDIEAMIRATLPAWHAVAIQALAVSIAGEKSLTFHLYTFLDQTARELAVPWKFAHEDPKVGSRSEDVSLVPGTTSGIWIEQAFFAGHERFYTIEAKRLPTPKDPKKDRTREYVCGDWDRASDPKKPMSGGIERFKENKHGERLSRSGMIAFVQEGTFSDWVVKVNNWIHDIATQPIPASNSQWSVRDALMSAPGQSLVHFEYLSTHDRPMSCTPITLRHYWVQLVPVLTASMP